MTAATIAFLIALITAAMFMGKNLHWLISVYAALLVTPILCTVWFRLRALRRFRFGKLPWPDFKRLYGWSALSFLSLWIFLYSIELFRGKWAYSNLKKEIEGKGLSLDFASIVPPPVSDEDNFCATPLLASLVDFPEESTWLLGSSRANPSKHLDQAMAVDLPRMQPGKEAQWTFAKPFDLEHQRYLMSLEPERFPDLNETNSAAVEIIRALQGFSPQLDELRTAMERPKARWNLRYEKRWFAAFDVGPRDSTLAGLVNVLSVQSFAHLAMKNSAGAEADTLLSLRLADTLKGEPLVFSFTLRQDLIRQTLNSIWEGLATRRWSAESLRRLQVRLGEISLLEDAQTQALRTGIEWMTFWPEMDRSLSLRNLFRNYRQIHERDRDPIFWLGLSWTFHPSGWTYQNMVHAYRSFDPATAEQTLRRLPIDPLTCVFKVPKYESLTVMFTERVPRLDLVVRQARIACALELYALQHGAYPENLAALSTDTPHEPLIGYRKSSNQRYLLYPAKMTEVSETLQPASEYTSKRQHDRFGDGVWRYPTKQ